jgi:hypothetical protein
MKALENRTLDSKREMEIMDALDEIRTRNARSERVDVDEVMDRFSSEDQTIISERMHAEEAEDDEAAKQIFQSADGVQVRKLDESAKEPDAISLVNQSQAAAELPSFKNIVKKRKNTSQPMVTIKKKKEDAKPAALSLISNYTDSDSD